MVILCGNIECLGDGLYSDMGRFGINFGGKWLFVSFGLSDRGWPGSKGKRSFIIFLTCQMGRSKLIFRGLDHIIL